MKRIICFGPGPKFKGGIKDYNTSLAKAFDRMPDTEVHIVSWTNQYPAIIPREFVDKSSKADLLEGTNVGVHYITDYNNTFTWRQTYLLMAGLEPDIVIFQWSIALQGLPIGRIARQLVKHKNIEVIFDIHFVVQKEGSILDRAFTRYGIKWADTYIAHAYKTVDELRALFPKKQLVVTETGERSKEGTTVLKLYHPVYDLFKPDPAFDVAGMKRALGLRKHVFLFFGFIRKYKGLHYCIRAFHKLAQERDDVSLLICGESFWNTLDQSKFNTRLKSFLFGLAKKVLLSKKEDEQDYNPLQLIDQLGIRDRVVVKNEFIANEDVHKYFQVSDAVLLFYEYATPSGIESLSYNFKKPLIATKVGHFPETIQGGFNGYLAEAGNIDSMATQMQKSLEHPIQPENIAKATAMMSWENYVKAILGL
ncbi:MAG TPA: glycosyltransferase [Saprospiraceae bacterium]|nr:glycosyltransferase [Saprospiraceae bacterium]